MAFKMKTLNMTISKGCPNIVCKSHKSLNGLRQSPQTQYLLAEQQGFTQIDFDADIYVKTNTKEGFIIWQFIMWTMAYCQQ